MIYKWTKEEIEQILLQLNRRNLPFGKYSFLHQEQGLKLLGQGGNAVVYEAVSRRKRKEAYAIKVIGFGDRHVDSGNFRKITAIQKELGQFQDDIVKIFEWKELRVWLEGTYEVVNVEEIKEEDEVCQEGEFLHLQFIVMEKLIPVIWGDVTGQIKLFPTALHFSGKKKGLAEQELLKLAYDIGMALSKAHGQKLLHRDVKLENVFYSPGKKKYKLGDFGIAKCTGDGMASTVVFTKGYGAPEVVGKLEDRYDNTADIYSYGMMLYVLLNELRFPESSNYRVNVKVQYSQGYVLPRPKHGTDDLCQLVEKLCRFYPDDRCQSMEEVLNELDRMIHGAGVKYQREHKKTSLVLGMIFVLAGTSLWFGDRGDVRVPVQIITICKQWRWLAVTLFISDAALFWEYEVAGTRDYGTTRMYFRINLIWLFVGVNSFCMMMLGIIAQDRSIYHREILIYLFGENIIERFISWNPVMVGLTSLVFCLFWKGREMYLARYGKMK